MPRQIRLALNAFDTERYRPIDQTAAEKLGTGAQAGIA
jgi:hypothetical protein